MTTASDIITPALKLVGAVAPGEPPSSEDSDDALNVLNMMLEGWNIDNLMCYQIINESFTWPATTASRTIGATGNFVTTRPVEILDSTYFRDTSANPDVDFPVSTITEEQYSAIGVKTTPGTYPYLLYCDQAVPNATIYVYPVPSSSLTICISSTKQLSQFTSLSTDANLPPGYKRALIYNLAVELFGWHGLAVNPSVAKIASNAKTAIKRINHKGKLLSLPYPLNARASHSDIYSDGDI